MIDLTPSPTCTCMGDKRHGEPCRSSNEPTLQNQNAKEQLVTGSELNIKRGGMAVGWKRQQREKLFLFYFTKRALKMMSTMRG